MGERNKRTDAVILSVRDQGENNRSVCAISPELGIFHATLYGGGKSKFRALVQQFHSGVLYIYDDEVRHTKKITDFDAKSFHTNLRSSLYKFWAANLAAELTVKTKCGGDYKGAFVLLSALIDGMDAVDEKEASLGMLRFLWRYLGLLGVQPEVTHCISCGQPLGNSACWDHSAHGFLCTECNVPLHKNPFEHTLSKEALSYLDAINRESPSYVRSLRLNAESAYSLKSFLYQMIEEAAGTRLSSFESGLNIL